MRRWALRIFVLLILGAIVNVAVAWQCYHGAGSRTDSPEWQPTGVTRTWVLPTNVGGPVRRIETSGLPMRSIQWSEQREPQNVLLVGFAVDTAMYAAIAGLIGIAVAAEMRRSRIRRGVCPNCEYDLRGSESAVCPECGAAVNRIAR